jgi:small subunit ribosomal protein S14
MAKVSKVVNNKKVLKKLEAYKASGKKKYNKVSTRYRNRCAITGRPRGYMRYFGVSRLTFRELAAAGILPGVEKLSK